MVTRNLAKDVMLHNSHCSADESVYVTQCGVPICNPSAMTLVVLVSSAS